MSANPSPPRWPAIDLLRGLTVAVMILVNEWAGVAGLPAWMKHMPADADAMSFVDMVFPAFLFIVGLSLPFALQPRLERAGRAGALRAAAERSAALVVTGLFMVNAELAPAGFNAPAWLLGALLGVFLLWGSAAGGPPLARPWRIAGALLLILLAAAYPGGMAWHWWGILGLIGWAYGLAALLFILAPPTARLALALLGMAGGVAWYAWAAPWLGGGAHATHTALVLAGLASALLLHGQNRPKPGRATLAALLLGLLLLALGLGLRPHWPLSKIHATPSWGLACAGATLLLYLALRPLAQAAPGRVALALLGDAARHPLPASLLPYAVAALLALAPWSWPAALSAGWAGIARGLVFLALVLMLLRLLLRAGLRLKL
jgi:predicted acyltransferase